MNSHRRMNMMSSSLGAGAAAMIHATVSLLTGNEWAGILSSIGFALSPTVWLYSIQGEVFGLYNFLVSCMAYLAVRYFQADAREYFQRKLAETSSPANGASAPSTTGGSSSGNPASLRLAY